MGDLKKGEAAEISAGEETSDEELALDRAAMESGTD